MIFSYNPWNLHYLLQLMHSSLLAYCLVLSVHGLSLSLDFSVFCYVFHLCFRTYVFITNMVATVFCPYKQIDYFPGPCVKRAAILQPMSASRFSVAHNYFWSSLRIFSTAFLETKTQLWKLMWALSGWCIGSSGSPLHPPLTSGSAKLYSLVSLISCIA